MTGNTLILQDITKSFDGVTVLNGISLQVNPGETLAIMGPSGSGKSTLLHCMSGILVPEHGQVLFGTTAVSQLSDSKRSALRLHHFGFVFQDGQLLPELTALENAALPAILRGIPHKKALPVAAEMLQRVGLSGLEGRRPGKMSGGQAQRVAIARAMAAYPSIIFADEPTGALDQATGHETMQQLTALTQHMGATLIVVTHDSKVAQWCSRRIEIRDGIIHDDRMQAGVR